MWADARVRDASVALRGGERRGLWMKEEIEIKRLREEEVVVLCATLEERTVEGVQMH